jgi:hypothetical protein
MGIGSPDLHPSQSVIDAVKLADDEKHINTRVIKDCQNCEKYG